jgi:hypothetical protein
MHYGDSARLFVSRAFGDAEGAADQRIVAEAGVRRARLDDESDRSHEPSRTGCSARRAVRKERAML